MKKLILSVVVAGSMMIAATACNSTKSVSDSTDSTVMDSSMMDTTMVPVDTATTMPPDTVTLPPDTNQVSQ